MPGTNASNAIYIRLYPKDDMKPETEQKIIGGKPGIFKELMC